MDLSTSEKAGLAESPGVTRAALGGEAMPVAAPSLPDQPLVTIDPQRSRRALDPQDFYAYRELLYFLAWRDIKVRYKQTLMGAAWVVVQPLFTMLVFTLVFHRLGGFRAEGIPYPLFAYSGLLLWLFFAQAVTSGMSSLILNTNLITRVYFPRMFIPLAAVGAGLVDLAVASLLLVGMLVYYSIAPTWQLLLAPFCVLLAVVLAAGFGLVVSALTVKYRDLRHAFPFLVQLLMFASPVIYPVTLVPEGWRWLTALNPMTGILEGFRSALTGQAIMWTSLGISTATAFALLVLSLYVFRRAEESFADVI